MTMAVFATSDIAAHNSRNDLWVAIHGKVYNVTKYVQDHPGGADVLIDVAGQDATAAFEDVGHSEDASEILEEYLIGTLKDAQEFKKPKTVRVIQQSSQPPKPAKGSSSLRALTAVVGSLGGAVALYFVPRSHVDLRSILSKLPPLSLRWLPAIQLPRGGFSNGFLVATVLSAGIGSVLTAKLSNMLQIESGFTKYPSYVKSRPTAKLNPHLIKGYLEPKEYKTLPLVQKNLLAPNVYHFVFQLPGPRDVIGLPIGQHVAIKANVDGAAVSRSYTPTSNNLDLGRLELVIKCYPDGLLTGKYLEKLQIGDKVQFRGPKGAMKYRSGLCKKIGMIAGGTGITPMYQLIRAICEDDRDTTEISLIYANRSEDDILLREELEAFARKYPKNFRVWYMLDHPPKKWAYGAGYVTPAVMKDKLPGPSPDTKVMLCGPPGMINAAKKGLASLGFQAPGAVAKMTDQIFCF